MNFGRKMVEVRGIEPLDAAKSQTSCAAATLHPGKLCRNSRCHLLSPILHLGEGFASSLTLLRYQSLSLFRFVLSPLPINFRNATGSDILSESRTVLAEETGFEPVILANSDLANHLGWPLPILPRPRYRQFLIGPRIYSIP